MAEDEEQAEQDDAGKADAAAKRARRPRAPVTIDLSATESQSASTEAVDERATSPSANSPGDPVQEAASASSNSSRSATAPTRGRSESSRTGVLALIIAGLVGGVIATALGIAGHMSGVLPSAGREQASAALTKSNALAGTLATLDQRVAAIEATGDTLASSANLEAIGGRISTLETTHKALSARLDRAESAAADAGGADGSSPSLSQEIADLRARIERIARQIGDGDGGDTVPLIEEIEGALGALSTEVKQLAARLDAVATRAASPAASERAARAFAIGALRQAAGKGGSFAGELGMLASLGTDTAATDALKSLAERGAPSRERLAAEFSRVADAILSSTQRVNPDAGMLDWLVGHARRLVSVRPVAPVPGTEPEAVVSRMMASVRGGDFGAALAEREQLPEAGKTASAAWTAEVENRLAIDGLIGKLAQSPAASPPEAN